MLLFYVFQANLQNNNKIEYINNDDFEQNKIDTYNSKEDENNFYIKFHIFLKNFEANNITIDIIEKKIKSIYESLEGKQEITKDDFLSPFINLFIELMKVTQEKDKNFIKSFLNEYLDYLNENTLDFFNNLMQIFLNLNDYSSIENNEDILNSLIFHLQKYQPDLGNLLTNDHTNIHLISFDKFLK